MGTPQNFCLEIINKLEKLLFIKKKLHYRTNKNKKCKNLNVVILDYLPPPTTRKIKILKKWEKTPEDIIILHKCIINDSHMMYGSWDMKSNRQNFL